jgi:hypothetical protein
LVLAPEDGSPLHPDHLSWAFRVPVKEVSERLGHSTSAFTTIVDQGVLRGYRRGRVRS